MVKPRLKQYGYWEVENDDYGYWMMYDSIKDLLSTHGDDADVYEIKAKLMGRYKLSVKTVRMKRSKVKK
jgi:hypothetical protein